MSWVEGYWNGFGVGADSDQRRLLKTIAERWLAPDGTALIDVFNPFVWARWDGDEQHRNADPDRGYAHELFERTTFDPVTCTAVDTWWEAGDPDHPISQTLRCYTPADLALLLLDTGLRLDTIRVGDEPAPPTTRPGCESCCAITMSTSPCSTGIPTHSRTHSKSSRLIHKDSPDGGDGTERGRSQTPGRRPPIGPLHAVPPRWRRLPCRR